MRRDMDLIRLLLLEREGEQPAPDLSAYSEEQKLYHWVLLIEAGLVHGEILRSRDSSPRSVALLALTWAGHEFLDSARDETVWKQTKGQLTKVGGTFALPVIVELLTGYAKQAMGMP